MEERALRERCFSIVTQTDTNGDRVDALFPPSEVCLDDEALERHREEQVKLDLAVAEVAVANGIVDTTRLSENIHNSLPVWYAKGRSFEDLSPEEQQDAICNAVIIPPAVMRVEGRVYLTGKRVDSKEYGVHSKIFFHHVFVRNDTLYCALHKSSRSNFIAWNSCKACKAMPPATESAIKETLGKCTICGSTDPCPHVMFRSTLDIEKAYFRNGQRYMRHITKTNCFRVVLQKEGVDYCVHGDSSFKYPCKSCKDVNKYIRDANSESPTSEALLHQIEKDCTQGAATAAPAAEKNEFDIESVMLGIMEGREEDEEEDDVESGDIEEEYEDEEEEEESMAFAGREQDLSLESFFGDMESSPSTPPTDPTPTLGKRKSSEVSDGDTQAQTPGPEKKKKKKKKKRRRKGDPSPSAKLYPGEPDRKREIQRALRTLDRVKTNLMGAYNTEDVDRIEWVQHFLRHEL